MNVLETPLPGVLIVEPRVFGDDRGFFLESWQHDRYRAAGIGLPFVQDNFSRSARGTLRGLHYQLRHPQGKLVSVSRGAVFDVAVDARVGSPTFGQWFGLELSEQNHRQLWIPPGFAHGFLALSEVADFSYKCTDYYAPDDDNSLLWNDPDLAIAWPLDGVVPNLSRKDAAGKPLKDATLPRFQG